MTPNRTGVAFMPGTLQAGKIVVALYDVHWNECGSVVTDGLVPFVSVPVMRTGYLRCAQWFNAETGEWLATMDGAAFDQRAMVAASSVDITLTGQHDCPKCGNDKAIGDWCATCAWGFDQ